MKKITSIYSLSISCFSLLGFSLLSFSLSASPFKSLEVSVENTNISLQYDRPQRLLQVLSDSHQYIDYSPYTLGASLVIKNSKIGFKKKENLINKINLNYKANDKVETKNNLLSILEKHNFKKREEITLDLEKIQLDKNSNPIIQGKYELMLPRTPNYIIVIDPSNSKDLIKLPLKYNYDFEDYINFYKDGFNIKNKIKSEKITIVQADKETIIPKVSYWNDKNYYLSPGAFIYIGIESSPQINSDFIDLLKYHVVF